MDHLKDGGQTEAAPGREDDGNDVMDSFYLFFCVRDVQSAGFERCYKTAFGGVFRVSAVFLFFFYR